MAKTAKVEYVLKPFKVVRKTKTASLDHTDPSFCDEPPPPVVFDGRSFCLTGNFEFENGDRNKCEEAVRARGGICLEQPNHDLDYLVIGTFVESSWAHKGYGRKIERALNFKSDGAKCKMISEKQWVAALQNAKVIPIDKRAAASGPSKSRQLVLLQRELDELKKNQILALEILKTELEPALFSKVSERFQKAGIII